MKQKQHSTNQWHGKTSLIPIPHIHRINSSPGRNLQAGNRLRRIFRRLYLLLHDNSKTLHDCARPYSHGLVGKLLQTLPRPFRKENYKFKTANVTDYNNKKRNILYQGRSAWTIINGYKLLRTLKPPLLYPTAAKFWPTKDLYTTNFLTSKQHTEKLKYGYTGCSLFFCGEPQPKTLLAIPSPPGRNLTKI